MPAGVVDGVAVGARVGAGVETPGPASRGDGPTANKFKQAKAGTMEMKATTRRSGEIIRLTCKAWRRVQLESDEVSLRGAMSIFTAPVPAPPECKRRSRRAASAANVRGPTSFPRGRAIALRNICKAAAANDSLCNG